MAHAGKESLPCESSLFCCGWLLLLGTSDTIDLVGVTEPVGTRREASVLLVQGDVVLIDASPVTFTGGLMFSVAAVFSWPDVIFSPCPVGPPKVSVVLSWFDVVFPSCSVDFSEAPVALSLSPVVFPSCSVDFSGVPVVPSWLPVVDCLPSNPFPGFRVVFSVVLFEVVLDVTTLAGLLVTVDLLVVLLRQVVLFLLGTVVVSLSLSDCLSVLAVALDSEAYLFSIPCLLEFCSEAGGAT